MQLYIYGQSYTSNAHTPKRPVKPGALLAAGRDLQLRAGTQPVPKCHPHPVLHCPFLPAWAQPFGGSERIWLPPVTEISPPSPLSGFRKPQRLSFPWGRAAISPFCLCSPRQALARRAPSDSQQQILRTSPGRSVGAPAIPLPSRGTACSQTQHTNGGNACAPGSGRPAQRRQGSAAHPKSQTGTRAAPSKAQHLVPQPVQPHGLNSPEASH